MSNGADPGSVLAALEDAQDAFELVGDGRPRFEDDLSTDEDWKLQLTKACRLLEVAAVLQRQDGYYTAVIEVCFGALERSIEAYALAMTDDELADFQDHAFAYERAHETGLFERETANAMQAVYEDNRTESYYGGGRPTERQAAAMITLSGAVHEFAVDQIRVGGVCRCESTSRR